MISGLKKGQWIAIGAAAIAVGIGAGVLFWGNANQLGFNSGQQTEEAGDSLLDQAEDSPVLSLATQSPQQRTTQLAELAKGSGLDRSRAQYLLAVDSLEQGDAAAALSWLENLEEAYEGFGPQVLLKRAQAYTAAGDAANATATWEALLATYPEAPQAAEALYALGKENPSYWEQAIQDFPAHPRTLAMVQQRLKSNPDSLADLKVLVTHGFYLPGIVSTADRLAKTHADQLQPEDWDAIAFAYWENLAYKKAGPAYQKGTASPLHAYRAARGLEIGQRKTAAIQAYRQLLQAYPDAPETADGLLNLVDLLPAKAALPYLDIVIKDFPDHAGEALQKRADRLDSLGSQASASQARKSVLSQYSTSDAAAQLRWQQVQEHAKQGNWQAATQWGEQLLENNPNSELAPEVGFWLGKWAQQQQQAQAAQTAYERVIAQYPESYYAWRSAVLLGWDVGNFTTVRDLSPAISKPTRRIALPTGSDVLQELYRLGQDRDAWTLWQVEFQNPRQPTVAEQFTDGLMRLGVGDNLDGMFMVSSLAWREQPDEQAQYHEISDQFAYWQALYPFPFLEGIQFWSGERQLNPLLVTALIRQESRFEPQIESVAGAVGLMQVLPSTADWIKDQTDSSEYSLTQPNDNLELGTWYLDYTHQEYNNNSLFAVASYNAGPGNVADWITRFKPQDPDKFVTQIPFPETQNYVKAVFGGYWNYLRLYNPAIADRVAQYASE